MPILLLIQIWISINGFICWILAGSKQKWYRWTPIACLYAQCIAVPYLIYTKQYGLLLQHGIYTAINIRNIYTITLGKALVHQVPEGVEVEN